MSNRSFSDVRDHPLDGDIVELREWHETDAEAWDSEVMLRVLAVREEHVWFKEYGKGLLTLHVKQWRARLSNVLLGKLVRPGDAEIPF